MDTSRGEHSAIFRKCAWRLIPFILIVYFINYLDRVNVGFAALTMNQDLGFSPAVFGFGAGVFFLGYFLFQIPGNLIMQRFGARHWMFSIMMVWGLISAANAFIQGPTSFYVLRFALGVAEAGFFPGMLLYLTYWFPQAYLARFTASFMTGIPLAFIIGGPLSSLILEMDGFGGMRGWQWLFLVEGLPACILALVALKVLPDGPAHAAWLTAGEKAVIAEQLSRRNTAEKRDFWPALRDPRILALGLVLVGSQFGLYGVQLWLPQIVQGMGYTNFSTGFIVALPFVASMGVMILWGRSSDIRGERYWHIGLAALFAALGLAVAGVAPSNLLVLVGLTLALAGTLSVPGPLFTLPSTILSGAAAASAIALVNSMGTLGRFLGPTVVGVFREESESFGSALFALAAGLVMSAVVIVALGRMIAPTHRSEVSPQTPR
jgi:ACS family tartrate transporter-like MFS transporter